MNDTENAPTPSPAPSDAVARALAGLRETQRALHLYQKHFYNLAAAIAVLEAQAGVARPDPAPDAASAAVVDKAALMALVDDYEYALRNLANEEMSDIPSPAHRGMWRREAADAKEALTDSLARLASELAAARADAERWRVIRPCLSVDGDVDHPDCGTSYEWIMVDEEQLQALTTREGWTWTVEQLVDAARAAAPGEGDAPAAEEGR